MDTKQLQEIKARADASWYDLGSFIGHARTDIPTLVAEVERLQKENNDLAVNGGKYMKIAQYRYELFEATAEQAEKAEIANIEKDQRINTLEKALFLACTEIARRKSSHTTKIAEESRDIMTAILKQAQEQGENK